MLKKCHLNCSSPVLLYVCILLYMRQVVGEQGRERKEWEQFQSGSTNQDPDLESTQLAQTPRTT